MTFKKRFIFLPFLALLTGFLFVSVYQEVKKQTIKEYDEQQIIIAKQTAKGIERLFADFFNEAKYLASNENIINFNEKGISEIKRHFKNHKSNIKAITRVDEKGIIEYTFPYNENAIGADISKQEHMKKILVKHEPVISDVFFAVQNFNTIAYHVPVYDDNKFKGTLALLIPFEKIAEDYLKNIKLKNNGYAWLISKKGIELFCKNQDHVGKSIFDTAKKDGTVIEIAKKMINGEEGTTQYLAAEHLISSNSEYNMHAVYCPIKFANSYWSICVATPEIEVLEAMTGFRNKLILIILFISIVGVVFTYFFIRAWIILIEEKKRKIAETKLKESEKKFRELSDLLPQIIYESDIKGKLTFVNKKAFEYFGYTKKEFKKGIHSIEMLVPEERERAMQNMKNTIMGKNQGPNEYLARRKDGSIFPVLIYSNPIFEDNKPKGLRGIIIDVTDIKKSEEALRKSEEQFRSYINNAPDGIFVMDEKNKILEVNRSICSLTGYNEQELQKMDFIELIDKDNQESFRKLKKELISSGKGMGDLTYITFGGHIKQWSMDAVKISEAKYLGFVKDITERKLLEEQLRQSQKMEAVGQLAGGVAHDFNNILTIINGYGDMLLNSLSNQSEHLESVKQILKAGERAEALTKQLLAFSRKQILRPKILDLNQLIKNLDKMLRRLISENIELKITYAEKLKYIKADPGQIEQVLLNLVINARDAMPAGGKLKVETSNIEFDEKNRKIYKELDLGKYIMLEITDTGIGMNNDIMSRIFDPFYTTKGEGKGTGLGLSTVYGIVKQSEGHIFVDSKQGIGTKFRIFFKAIAQELEDDFTSKSDDIKIRGTETILVIEDDDSVRNIAVTTLKRNGYNVLSASGGKQAYELINSASKTPDLLLTDVVMPEESGHDIAMKMKKIIKNLKIIYMSGYTNDAIVKQGVLEENTNFIHKPFSPKNLLIKTREVIDKK